MSEYIWRDSDGNGLTQAEADDLAHVWLRSPEVWERAYGQPDDRRMAFYRWMVETGRLSDWDVVVVTEVTYVYEDEADGGTGAT